MKTLVVTHPTVDMDMSWNLDDVQYIIDGSIKLANVETPVPIREKAADLALQLINLGFIEVYDPTTTHPKYVNISHIRGWWDHVINIRGSMTPFDCSEDMLSIKGKIETV